jgi:hypothetical protein
MSQWTHISGLIRYDDLMSDRAQAYKEMRKIEDTYFADAPHGSEGPMEYTIIPTHQFERREHGGTTHGPGLCDVAISGNFRDFHKDCDDSGCYRGHWSELEKWFQVITEDEDVRQAVLLIESDGYPTKERKILVHAEEEKK